MHRLFILAAVAVAIGTVALVACQPLRRGMDRPYHEPAVEAAKDATSPAAAR